MTDGVAERYHFRTARQARSSLAPLMAPHQPGVRKLDHDTGEKATRYLGIGGDSADSGLNVGLGQVDQGPQTVAPLTT